jgi:hypothetical protein
MTGQPGQEGQDRTAGTCHLDRKGKTYELEQGQDSCERFIRTAVKGLSGQENCYRTARTGQLGQK